MRDHAQVIGHMLDTGDQTGVEMAKEVLGPTMSTC